MLRSGVQIASAVARCVTARTTHRCISVTAVNKALDPVQKVFADQISKYNDLSSKQGGGAVDAGPEYEQARQEAINRIAKMFNVTDDPLKFPEFKFEEPDLNQDDTDFTES
ncbi:unnamed protein product [Clavelina lepadiformis]|uniref:ATP synthase peripheral stalk subunit F6, mitochondrial n=1 Tax=Clavelina lepadiformis TaxID=159417 RepID=A0ABP0EZT3_CLALP